MSGPFVIEESKQDVSFTTLLNDSNLSFDPVKDEKEESASKIGKGTPSLKARKQAMADSIAIAELTMKITELENEYDIYKEKTEL